MILLDLDRCDGCGVCLDVCPEDALVLRDGKATLVEGRCTGCDVCVTACPQGAIRPVTAVSDPWRDRVSAAQEATVEPLRAPGGDRTVEVPSGVSKSALVWPAVGSALLWTGQKLLPQLVTMAGDLFSRRTSPRRGSKGRGRSGPRQQRVRRRGR